MKLSNKLLLSAAVVTALFTLDAWLDDRDAIRQRALLQARQEARDGQARHARETVRLLNELETFILEESARTTTPTPERLQAGHHLINALRQAASRLSAEAELSRRTGSLAREWDDYTRTAAAAGAGGQRQVILDHLRHELAAAQAALLIKLATTKDAGGLDTAAEIELIDRHRLINLGSALFAAGIIGLVLWLWRRDLIRPLRQMEHDARSVSAGRRPNVRFHYDRQDELGAVAHAFNEALDVLQSTAYSRSELERLVEERSSQLRAREAQLQRVIEGSGQGYWDWNVVTGRVTFAGRWADMLGYRLDELEHSFATWERLLHPEDRPRALAAVEAHIRGSLPTYEVEHRMLTKDGAWRWVLSRGLVVERDATGRAVHLAGTHTDIHDRKLAEENLRLREEQLRLVSDNFPEGALYQFVVGPDGVPRNTYIGEGFKRILGIERDTPLADWRWLEQHVVPEDLPALRTAHQHAIAHRQPLRHQIRARTRGGELKWLSFRSHPRDGGNGQTIWDGVMIDITRLKQAEAEIAAQADFHAALNATTVDLLNRRARDELLQAIVERAAVLLDAPHVELAFVEGDELVTRAYAGSDPEVLGDHATRAEAILSWRAVDTRQPAVTDDYASMEGAREVYNARGSKAVAVFPILLGDTCIAIFGVVRFQAGARFTPTDLQKGQLLAQTVALVLHHSSIYADAVRVAEARTQDLRESESRLREAQRIAHLGHWEYAFGARDPVERWSDETYRIFGLEPQSVRIDRARFDSFIHPEDLSRVRAAIATHFAARSPFTLHYRIVRPDGTVRAITDSGEPKRAADGAIVGMQGIIQDVTERAAAEASLRASESRFKRVVENIGDALMVDDEEGRIVFANDRFLDLFRLRREDVPGRTIFDHVLPGQREATRSMHRARMAGEPAPAMLEVEAVRADGTRFWVEIRVTPVVEEGRIVGSQAALRDITERRLIEQTLRLLSTGTAHLAGAAFYDYVTVRLAGLLGVEMAVVASFHPGERPLLRTLSYHVEGAEPPPPPELALKDTLAGAVLRERGPVRVNRLDQAFPADPLAAGGGPVSATAVPLTGAAGEVIGLVAVFSRREAAPAALADSVLQLAAVRLAAEIARESKERQFRDLFDFAPDAIVMVQRSGQIGRINRRAEALFGYPPEELVGQAFSKLVPASAAEAMRLLGEQFDAAPRSRALGEHGADFIARRQDGTPFPAELSFGVIEGEGEPLVAIAVRDLTLQRRAEARLRQSQKMESLGTLAGGIAHDFNNILTGISGFIELALIDLPAGHPSRPWLHNIATASGRAKNLVKQILTFSRQHEGERTTVDVTAVVAEALRLLRSTLPPMVRIDEQLATPGPCVQADSTQLHQVVMNLATNAWHAMPESGGTLTVRVDTVVVAEEELARHPELPRGEAARITVSDDGSGMTPEVLERVFEPFFTTKTAGRGTGLGLSVVHGVIRAHGGAIVARSTPGAGSSFEIYLPAIARPVPADTAPSNPPQGQGQRLMLVDDDSMGREAMVALLRRLGYVVEDFEHPQVAFTRFASQPSAYAAVLTDFAMPLMTGADLTRQLRAVREDVPVLLITGYVEPAKQEDLLRSGVNSIVRKPPTVEELAEAVRKCLRANAG